MSCNENIPHLSIVPSKGSRQSTLDDSSEKCVLRTNNAMHNPSYGQSEHKFNKIADSTVGFSGNKLSSFFCPKLLVAGSRSVDSVVLVKVVKLFWFSLVERGGSGKLIMEQQAEASDGCGTRKTVTLC